MTRNIQDVASLLAPHFIDIEEDQRVFESNLELVTKNASKLGLFYKYQGLLHDSFIVKTNITTETFLIELNDFTTHVFADALIEKKNLKIDEDKLIFPIQIEFEIRDLTFNTTDDNGDIHEIEPISVDEYLYEQIISVHDDIVELGIVVWKSNGNKPGQQILILISAKSILLTELQDQNWSAIFGTAYDEYYKYFKLNLNRGRYLSDIEQCRELINELDSLH